MVQKFILKMLNTSLVLDPAAFLLFMVDSTLSVMQKYTSLYAITATRILYAQK